jgi:UDP-3-O-[3-hydroxymyristoyl] N-acetylglucosamine deacetylase
VVILLNHCSCDDHSDDLGKQPERIFDMHSHQRTLSRQVQCSGVGLHSGRKVNLTIKPAPVNHGIKFVRTDLPHKPVISAHFRNVIDTSLATTLGMDGVIVSTVEHLMASFAGLSIDNALVEMDAYEAPIMDGSAGPFTTMLQEAGIHPQSGKRYWFVVKKPIEMEEEDRKVSLEPSDTLKITYTIDFDHPLVKRQSFTISLTDSLFEKEISRARTFGFLHEVNYLKQNGFARGGSLENAIVVDQDRILNEEGLRYEDEFVRHKVLDCIGDLSLLGMPFIGHIVAYKSGHALNHALLKKFIDQKACWETVHAPSVSP